jgi:tetratricopeptide (TPR) repeat protein
MSVSARPAAEAPPPPAGPTLATGPAGETPEAQLKRLSALFVRLQKADHFAALGLDRKATTTAEAKRAFFALAKELHPDTVTDATQTELRDLKEALFARINEAAQVLSDDARRKAYEQELDGKAQTVDIGRVFAAEENFQRAEIMIKARKYQDGLALLEEAIHLNADEAEFYAWRGYARFLVAQDRKEAYPDSAADCRKAIRMMDRCVPAHLFLGHMSKVVGDAKLAQACYERVLQLEPRHVEAQREMRLMGKR